MERARENAQKADLFLVLGSSLTVTPANELPEAAGRGRRTKLVICNLQPTPLDELADMRVHAESDDLMILVMLKLGISIPRFILRRRLAVKVTLAQNGAASVLVEGIDVDNTPLSFLRSVRLQYNRRHLLAEPFLFKLRGVPEAGTMLKLDLEFMGHYNEPNLEISHVYDEAPGTSTYQLEFDPYDDTWKVTN